MDLTFPNDVRRVPNPPREMRQNDTGLDDEVQSNLLEGQGYHNIIDKAAE